MVSVVRNILIETCPFKLFVFKMYRYYYERHFNFVADYEQRNKMAIDGGGPKEGERNENSMYPIETYQGLEEATAERIKRFEDETKAMLMRNSRTDLTPATPEMGRTTSGNNLI